MNITDEVIQKYIKDELDFNDFGYLVVPDDARLNDEAAMIIKEKFKKWIEEQEPTG